MSLRVVSLNMWGKFGPHEARWGYAERCVPSAKPDVLCVQEGGNSDYVGRLAKAAGLRVVQDDTGSSGLALLSRLDCAESGLVPYAKRGFLEPYTRKFQWMRVRDGKKDLLFTNTHLAWKKGDDKTRAGQTGELAVFVTGKKLPAVLCGDFNCEYGSAPLECLRQAGFRDLLAGTALENAPTWDNANPFIRSHPEKFPDRRIDLILANPDFLKLRPFKEARIDFKDPDPKTGLLLSDHWGVITDFA